MNMDFSEEQQILDHSAREFLRRECPRDLTRKRRNGEADFDRQLWRQMAELGWMGVAIAEEYGGAGGDFGDLAVLLEAMGEACLPAPFFSTVVIAANALRMSKRKKLQQELLPRIAAGELVCSYALIEPGNTYGLNNIQTQATSEGDNFTLNGIKLFVEYGQSADYLLTVAQLKGEGLVVLMVKANSPGIEIKSHPTLDYADQCEIRLSKVKVPGSQVLAMGQEAVALLLALEEISAVGKCAEMLGNMQAVLDMSVSYVRVREQFGQAVGSFQAVQHHCANMAIDVDSSRYITRMATWRIAQGLPATKEASMAKSYTSGAAVRVAKLGHQTHGAISFCDELDMHLFLRRAHAASIAFGDAEYHQEKVAQELGL